MVLVLSKTESCYENRTMDKKQDGVLDENRTMDEKQNGV
jgi:hypothetical protein